MDNFAVKSHHELMAALRKCDISVPPRADGRSKQHTERWSIARFLATYGHTSTIRYPLSVEKGERPDYRLNVQGVSVGIEITESVSEDLARLDALLQRNDEWAVVDASLFRPGVPRRSNQELRTIANAKPHGEGWAGLSAEREWAEAIAATVLVKAESATKPGFTLFTHNWLLVYDNWSFPQLDASRAALFLAERLTAIWAHIVFSRVFIERGQKFVSLSSAEHCIRTLNDVWKEG